MSIPPVAIAIAMTIEKRRDTYPVDNLPFPLFLKPQYYSPVKLDGWGFHLRGSPIRLRVFVVDPWGQPETIAIA
ncbi:hypothetical protein H4N54_02205 [Limnospira fusiformis KN01]|uniref:Uncharacterized protein n=2 Tax=Limnospira TaxID=2596745 RepID=B5W1G5_LIMMA|nr:MULTISPECIES: hypothetical protein [Limnospira]EDZ94575.1 hypothetical protein AmaxDRAFT_2611 [Limnospira maxima CS-328]MDT9271509.1 hypothetical protein [Limnospira sp. PMC 1234.20]MDT9302209.1 hypothetical protein [Limnospira sp. PMC 1281.21]MDY7055498.1 hypothetical protein [Limnospira fusiformis LS22]UWU46529.1 hypothetical protein APLC1_1246 [Arthrospira platensis C1]